MYKNRLQEIKTLHSEATKAYYRHQETGACADSDKVTDTLHKLFQEEHTDWLIGQAEKVEKIEGLIDDIVIGDYSDLEEIADKLREIAG